MKYRLQTTHRFDRQLRNCLKRGYDEHLIEDVVTLLVNGEKLPSKHKPHKLKGKYHDQWECHITPDWLFVWQQNDTELILLLLQTGTHPDLFN